MFVSTFKLKLNLVKSSVEHVYIPEFHGESRSEVGILKMSKMAILAKIQQKINVFDWSAAQKVYAR